MCLLSMMLVWVNLLPFSAHAVDRLIPFSAKLKSVGSGEIVPDGTYNITFRLYNVASGGTAFWSETQSIQVTQGTVSTNLGAVTALPSSALFNDTTYLGIQVGSDPEASPRKRLGSVPSALNAEALAGATANTSGAANTIPILDSGGSLTLQGGMTVGSAILPSASGINLGSSTAKFGTVYADTLAVDAATINGTTSEFFAVNTDQVTNNTEDEGIRFYLGPTLNTYSALQWTASSNRFDLFSRTDTATLADLHVASTTINGSLDVSGAVNFTSTLSVASDFTVNTNKLVVLAASGNTTIAGTLGVTGDTSLSTLSTSGLASLQSLNVTSSALFSSNIGVTGLSLLNRLTVNGDSTAGNTDITLGDATTDQLVVTAAIASNLIPLTDNTYDLGASNKRWANFYAANAVFDQLSTPNTTAADFVINSDNATADTEDATLQFERGSTSPNAIIGWNSTSDYLYSNQNFVFQGNTTIGDASGDAVTSVAATWAFSNATAVALTSATAALNFSSGLLKLDTTDSRVGINIGSNTPAATLHVLSTTEQQRLGYDLSNYLSTTVSSTGLVTLDAVGSGSAFNFSDSLGIGGTPLASKLLLTGNLSSQSWTTAGIQLQAAAATYTDTNGSGTIATRVANSFAQPTFASSSAVTVTNAATLYIANSPAQGSNTTINNAWALWVAAGNVKLDGTNLTFGNATTVGLATSATALTFSNSATPSTILDIDAQNNRVGIGTSAPKTKLHVEDNGGGITLSTGGAGDVYQTFRSSIANSLWDRWRYNSATANLTFEKNTDGVDTGANFDTTTPWLQLGWNSETLAVNTAAVGQFTSRAGSAFTSSSSAGYFWGNATSSTASVIQDGVRAWVDGVNNGTGAKNIGVYVENVTGGTNNYDAIFNGSAVVGIGTTSPTGKLTVTTKGTPDETAWGTSGKIFQTSGNIRDGFTAGSGTVATEVFNSFGQNTLSAFNSNVTTTNAATVYIADAPAQGTNMTISNAWALWVDNGNSRFDTAVKIGTTAVAANMALDIDGRVQINLGGTQTSTALCGSHAGGTGAAVSDVEIVDCTGTPAADYTELYPMAANASEGDLMAIGTTDVITKTGERITQLVKAEAGVSNNVIGVFSNNISDFSTIGYNIKDSDNPHPVALNGRVPVKVATDSSVINRGDLLTISATPGRVTKVQESGWIVGRALENWVPGQDKVMMFVTNSWYNPGQLQSASITPAQITVASIEQAVSGKNITFSTPTFTVNGQLITKQAATFEGTLLAKGSVSIEGSLATKPSATQTLLPTDAILANASKIKIRGNGTIELASTPTIAAGADGQLLILQGTDDANTVTLHSETTLTGTKLKLGATTRTLGRGDVLTLTYDTDDAVWYEVSFSRNKEVSQP